MPTSGRRPDVLADTSVAVALMVSDHEYYEATIAALDGRVLGLAGHAAFETFSVLTRLPPPARRSPAIVSRMMTTNFPLNRFLSAEATVALFERFSDGKIAGGAVYDALVGAVAMEHGHALITLDHRARGTHRVLGLAIELVPTA